MLSDLREPGFIEYIGKSVVVLGHHNADPDAMGSAQGVKELVEQLKPDTIVEIVMPDDISKLSTKLIQELGLDIHEDSSIDFDTIVVVDAGGLNQLGDWATIIQEKKQVVVLIDHHILDEQLASQVDLLIHNEEASSTCELVYRLYVKTGITPSVKTSSALLAGIAFDTRFFSLGKSDTFRAVSDLLQNIGDVSEIREIMQSDTDASEKIARLKAGQRAQIHQVKEWIIAFSELSSYQASGARALIQLGADLAIVIGEEKKETRASLRSTQSFHNVTHIHLGELISEFSAENGGMGSGHPTAAGYNGVISHVILRQKLLKNIIEQINQ